MRFRYLRDFNLAMLAKQGWRMLQGNESLLYKCFKARYFPQSSFLDAKESPRCSYVCRSFGCKVGSYGTNITVYCMEDS